MPISAIRPEPGPSRGGLSPRSSGIPENFVPRVGFIVTNMSRPAERVVAFYNKRGTCEQWIKEGKGAIKWTRLSCRTFAANAVRLQLHALAYNLGNFLRTLATPEPIKDWSLTSLTEVATPKPTLMEYAMGNVSFRPVATEQHNTRSSPRGNPTLPRLLQPVSVSRDTS